MKDNKKYNSALKDNAPLVEVVFEDNSHSSDQSIIDRVFDWLLSEEESTYENDEKLSAGKCA